MALMSIEERGVIGFSNSVWRFDDRPDQRQRLTVTPLGRNEVEDPALHSGLTGLRALVRSLIEARN